jgi:hypothetical protein
VTPSALASFSAPSLSVTKKGLFSVESTRPRVSVLGGGVVLGVVGVGLGLGDVVVCTAGVQEITKMLISAKQSTLTNIFFIFSSFLQISTLSQTS